VVGSDVVTMTNLETVRTFERALDFHVSLAHPTRRGIEFDFPILLLLALLTTATTDLFWLYVFVVFIFVLFFLILIFVFFFLVVIFFVFVLNAWRLEVRKKGKSMKE